MAVVQVVAMVAEAMVAALVLALAGMAAAVVAMETLPEDNLGGKLYATTVCVNVWALLSSSI
jgi:hypothetical protein